ncbi:hypothetical protein [Pseudotabrizicola sp. 4114]|uniref:hypothetical protein n=1 Tax=Pseudotabrizicola sp. 4114 TaxID=2817731 RepID=UPI0032B72F72
MTVVALAGCVPIEGEAPKICASPNARPYGDASGERCKMVQTKTGVKTTAGSGGQANY